MSSHSPSGGGQASGAVTRARVVSGGGGVVVDDDDGMAVEVVAGQQSREKRKLEAERIQGSTILQAPCSRPYKVSDHGLLAFAC